MEEIAEMDVNGYVVIFYVDTNQLGIGYTMD
jgi:hypothetical protein